MSGVLMKKLISCLLAVLMLATMTPTARVRAEQEGAPAACEQQSEPEPTEEPQPEEPSDEGQQPEEPAGEEPSPEEPGDEESSPEEEEEDLGTAPAMPMMPMMALMGYGGGISGVSVVGVPTGYTGAASVALSADVSGSVNEDSSGVTFQWYVNGSSVSGATSKNYTMSFTDGTAGTRTVKVKATYSGNSETSDTETVYYDRKAPGITGVAFLDGYAGGWTKGPVAIKFTATDADSGVKTVKVNGTPLSLAGDGKYTANVNLEGDKDVTIVVTDNAGNSATNTSLHTKIDNTAPTVGCAAFTGGYAGGWTKESVGVEVTVADAGSGVKTVTVNGAPATLSGGKYTATVSLEGDNPVAIEVADNLGNSATDTSLRTKIDRIAPTVAASAVPDGWTNATSVQISASASDSDGSGVKKLQYKIDGDSSWSDASGATYSASRTTAGTRTYKFRALDNAGNYSEEKTVCAKIDRTDPSFRTSVSPSGWTNAAGGVKVTACDVTDVASGVASVAFNGQAVEPDADGKYEATTTAEGKTAFEIAATDNAGNEEKETVYAYYDVTKPTFSVRVEPSGWTNGAAGVKVTVYDVSDAKAGVNEVSGIQSVKIGGQTVSPDVEGKYSLVCTGEGKTTVDIRVADKAGNEATDTAYTYIDVTKPIFAVRVSEDGWTKEDVTITIYEVSDENDELEVSDIDEVTVDGFAATPGDGEYTYVVGAEGEIGHTVRVTDKAGNETTYSVTTKIDRTAPEFEVSADEENWAKEDVTLTISNASDENDELAASGIDEVTVDGFAATPGDGGYTYVVSAEGEIEHTIVVIDHAGNSTEKKLTTKIDRTALVFEVSADKENWTKEDVTLSISNASDENGELAVSGIDKVAVDGDEVTPIEGEYTYAVSAEGEIEHTIVVTDYAGSSTEKKLTTRIDKTAPEFEVSADKENWTKEDVALSISNVSDENGELAVSGIDKVAVDGDEVTPIEGGYTYVVSAEGEIEHAIVVTDHAGNSTEKKLTTKIDKTAPTITSVAFTDGYAGGWTKGPVAIKFTATDADSGVKTVTVNGTSLSLAGDGKYTASVSLEGDKDVAIVVTDSAGNSATDTSLHTKIDRTERSTESSTPQEIKPVLLTMTPNDRLGICGIALPGSTVRIVYKGVTYIATVDEYGCFTFSDIPLTAGEGVRVIVTDPFGNTFGKTYAVAGGADIPDHLSVLGKTFLYEAEWDDEALKLLSAFASPGAVPSEADMASVWFAAIPVAEGDFADGIFEAPLLLGNRYALGRIAVTRRADGTFVATYAVDEALAAAVDADGNYLGVAYTDAAKADPEARDFVGARSIGFGNAFALEFGASARTWIIARVQVRLDTVDLTGLAPIDGELAELYDAYQTNG